MSVAMPYLIAEFSVANSHLAELAIALLAEIDFDSFEETANSVKAYIETAKYDPDALTELTNQLDRLGITLLSVTPLEEKNWNEEWEKNFEPITVDDQILVRAPFHPIDPTLPFVITIEPKMAFGTGHHETTWLMLHRLLQLEVSGKAVFDFGCGTGILAIMAAKKGASHVVAIDNDEWAYHSAIENAQVNQTPNLQIRLGDHTALLPHELFHLILANINRNVIVETIQALTQLLLPMGKLLLSGILIEDQAAILLAASPYNLAPTYYQTRGNWAILELTKVDTMLS
ncbi:MAG TPA: 50S ribosomal protein L11 methyltransferase [Chitinophagales bacterium]|nr:50S ribosomal protein L11 methyltransferase [Chitinophagales bacterium]HRK27270.1 50S ribosomal protein L11 methyltransferase [Chitinophagales bacterium]